MVSHKKASNISYALVAVILVVIFQYWSQAVTHIVLELWYYPRYYYGS